MAKEEITRLEQQIFELTGRLNELRKSNSATEIRNYSFETLDGERTLRELFGDREKLLVIHNMGQGCRYCTLWADGFNGLLPHLESVMSVVLVSKDRPVIQRRFANSRGWRFRVASHQGGDYIREQTVSADSDNMPGAVVYERKGNTIYRKNECAFGPGDMFSSMWNLLGMAGFGGDDWTPQFNYWQRPKELDDGGEDLLE